MRQARLKGEAEGGAKVLTRMLEKRFGVVPGPFRQRIFSADVSEIESWVERAVAMRGNAAMARRLRRTKSGLQSVDGSWRRISVGSKPRSRLAWNFRSELFLETALTLELRDDVRGRYRGTDLKLRSARGLAFQVGEEPFHVWILWRLFIHRYWALREKFGASILRQRMDGNSSSMVLIVGLGGMMREVLRV